MRLRPQRQDDRKIETGYRKVPRAGWGGDGWQECDFDEREGILCEHRWSLSDIEHESQIPSHHPPKSLLLLLKLSLMVLYVMYLLFLMFLLINYSFISNCRHNWHKIIGNSEKIIRNWSLINQLQLIPFINKSCYRASCYCTNLH